jgi:RHS repeat-associated protein
VYDCAGNLRDLLGTTADYDGENRVKSAVKGGTTVTYAYDGDGRRVQSTVGAVSTVFVYTAFGQLAAEYGAGPAEGRKYLYADALGSTRLESCAGCAQTVKRFDYLPFGEEMSTSSRTAGLGYGLSGSERVKFTGKERDVETGLDYFGARYFSGGMGRFTSADPHSPMMIAQMATAAGLPYEAARSQMDEFLENPQNWNKYTYTLNNPLRFVDPLGETPVDGHHLIPARGALTGLAAEFADFVKAGEAGVGYPNQPGFNGPHRAYNAAAEQILQGFEKQFGGLSRNRWSLSQWKQAANGILNSNNKAIRDFLDLLNKNNAGRTIPALTAAINAYRPSAALIASTAGESLLNLFRLPLIMMVNPAITNPQKRYEEEIEKDRKNCLLDRETGNCVY